jgi:hypothetical protein
MLFVSKKKLYESCKKKFRTFQSAGEAIRMQENDITKYAAEFDSLES